MSGEGEPGEGSSDAGDSAGAGNSSNADEPEVLLELPDSAREAFKEPFGPVYDDVRELLAAHGPPIVAVGDIVTYHLEEGGHRPTVAFVDGRTKRESAPETVRETVAARANERHVRNPPGTITVGLLAATVDALAAGEHTTVVVDGEEDLAAVPAVLAAPDGATVVYGQPDEGMVAVDVTDEGRAAFRELFEAFEGDRERALEVLDAA